MKKGLSRRLGDWGTGLRDRVAHDPLRATRLQLLGMYLLAGFLIFMVLGWLLNAVAFEQVYETTLYETGDQVEEIFSAYQEEVMQRRAIIIVLFVLTSYFITEFALRPVRKAAELQKHFIAIVSHELRTPLAVMKNMSEIALRNEEGLDRERSIAIIKSNLEETDRLSDTVQFLLTFSSLLSRKAIPNEETVPLADILARVHALLAENARERGVAFTWEAAPGIAVNGNRIALEGLLTNLAKNALQHTPAGGAASMRALRGAHDRPLLVVADTGPGIPPADMPYVFEPFFRGPSVGEGGYGLGLSIARQVADLHRASISVKSDSRGTTFTVTFPRP